MGLENLQSIFTEGIDKKFGNSDLTKMVSEFSTTNTFENSSVTTMDSAMSNTTEFINTSVTNIDSIYDDLSEITPSSVELLTTSYQIENLLSGTTLKDRALADVEFLPAHGDYQIGPGESTFQFISPLDGSKLYDTYTYDPRTALPRTTISKHAYVGTRFDDGAGGLFNSEDRYATVFGLTNSPKGYAESETGSDIIEKGNIVTGGTGYDNKKSLMEIFVESQEASYKRYFVEGSETGINQERTNIQEAIPLYNELVPTNGFVDSPRITIGDDDYESLGDTGWDTLYNEDHTAKPDVGYNYSQYVNRSRLNIRHPKNEPIASGISFSRESFIGGAEPYIVTPIGGDFSALASREIPIARAIKDTERVVSYMASLNGIMFIGKQLALGLVTNVLHPVTNADGTTSMIRAGQRFGKFYNPLSTILSTAGRLLGTVPVGLMERGFPGASSRYISPGGLAALESIPKNVGDVISQVAQPPQLMDTQDFTFNRPETEEGAFASIIKSGLGTVVGSMGIPFTEKEKSSGGDAFTNLPMKKSKTLPDDGKFGELATLNVNVETEQNGMPFYFKDLRDNTYVFFRAYIDSISDNISSSWSNTSYVGRSEDSYTYERGERTISLGFKLFAHTATELENIYQKMNRLTSMCYPEYHAGTGTSMLGKTRMKPPLARFRLGELFGYHNNEMVGFIETLTYEFPPEATWETIMGKRVPKLVSVSLDWRVIHGQTPSLAFAQSGQNESFYGIVNENSVLHYLMFL